MLTKSSFIQPNIAGASTLPDVSNEVKSELESTLEWVGMSQIEMPVRWQGGFYPARVGAFVNLNKSEAKGIHMSRLYLKVQECLPERDLDFKLIHEILSEFIDSHKGLSDEAQLKIEWSLPVKRKALVSQQTGWRTYPVWVEAHTGKGFSHIKVGGEVLYSSTCPCSASLSRQLIQKKFLKDFESDTVMSKADVAHWLINESSAATPHAQRSVAKYSLLLDTELAQSCDFLKYIDDIEAVLATPVQAAVKRQDEQMFALLNGQNLMFCEDAARKLQKLFNESPEVKEYWAEVSHNESLHPHNAVAKVHKRK